MTARADLHVHSSASDGMLRPARIVELAASKGLAVLSITDHDTTEGLDEALDAAQGFSLTLVPGVELNARSPHGQAHVLGYFIDPDNAILRRRLRGRREARDSRAEAMLGRLRRLGYPLSWSRVLSVAAGGAVGRPHVARALVEAGYVCDVDEAFRRLIRRGAPAYIPTPWLDAAEAVQWILEAGGLPVLAHPLQVLQSVPSLVRASLAGLEVFYGGYGPADTSFLSRLASRMGLLQTGGSDFHGGDIPSFGDMGSAPVPWEHVERLLEAAAQRGGVVSQ